MRAAICVRVSPRPQDKVRYSPEIQESKCREWCEANGHEVVLVIQDILVSGGATNRFDSIFAAIDKTPVDVLVVSDLSRWTRDDPDRFWYIHHVLRERGVRLYSVQESWLGGDMPFAATITTATVEANAREREILRLKTSEGVRRAVAAGKWFGRPRFGWTWLPEERRYAHDVDRIRALYDAWNRGDSMLAIGERFGMRASHVRQAISAQGQRQIVGDEVWLRAQQRPKGVRAQRSTAQVGSPYRRLLACPFCGNFMQHHPHDFYSYECRAAGSHPWRGLSTRLYVTAPVQTALASLKMPDDEAAALAAQQMPETKKPRRNVAAELDRLGELFVRGRLSQDRYERLAAELEAERDGEPLPPKPIPERIRVLQTLDHLDFNDRSTEGAILLNRILREVVSITLAEDRQASVAIMPDYAAWQTAA